MNSSRFKFFVVVILIVTLMSSCNNKTSSLPDNYSSGLSVASGTSNAQNQVVFLEEQAKIIRNQIKDVSYSTLSNDQKRMGHLLVPTTVLKEWQELATEVIRANPELQKADFVWLSEATQLVPKSKIDTVTDDLLGFFVIRTDLRKGPEGDWAVMFIMDLDSWKILDWRVNDKPFVRTSNYRPPWQIYDSPYARRVYDDSIKVADLRAELFEAVALKESK